MKRFLPGLVHRRIWATTESSKPATTHRAKSSKTNHRSHKTDSSSEPAEKLPENQERQPAFQSKTTQELDEDLRLRLEMMSGSGGAAGIQYENGRAEGMKREVKRNMFRII
jgi:hypothetical protein